MDEQACPRCKTTRYRNPSLKLMVNVCGHALCENCVELLFVRGSGACPECAIPLRRNNFRMQLFEDATIEKEVDIRKKILRAFNKKEDDFISLRLYNDYLEHVETIIFNLANNIDVESTKKMVENYKRDNQDQIKKNRSKMSQDDEFLESLIVQEKQQREIFRLHVQQVAALEQQEKRKTKEALIDELMFSDLPADHIVASHRKEVQSAATQSRPEPVLPPVLTHNTTFSTGIQLKQQRFMPVVNVEEGVKYIYTEQTYDYLGPDLPTRQQLHEEGYLVHIRATTTTDWGGGYETDIGCLRALQDAFCGLYFNSVEIDQYTHALTATSSGQTQAMNVD